MPYSHRNTPNGTARSGANPDDRLQIPLFDWQKECLDIWFSNRGKGVVNVVTGAGKTILALGAIARLQSRLAAEGGPALKVKIVVPKVFLAQQWARSLQDYLAVAREDIGIYCGIHKDPPSRQYLIYVVNSARATLSPHIRSDYLQGNAVLLIADECHHYGSPENARIFAFTDQIPVGDRTTHYYGLGLSATPELQSGNENLLLALGPEIYTYSFAEALNARIISSFAIFNIKLRFTPAEDYLYQDLSDQLTRIQETLIRQCAFLRGLSRRRYFSSLEQLAQSSEGDNLAMLARAVLNLAGRRKDLVYRAESRVSCVRDLLPQFSPSSRVLIFCERIAVADTIYAELLPIFPGQVGRYHSDMDQGSRQAVLRQYRDARIRILISCRALDEGLNVPATDIGIIVSSTSSPRQRIQRLGRVLRRSGIKRTARLYYLYIGASNEEKELLAEVSRNLTGIIPILDLDYDQDTHTFGHPAYQALADQVIAFTQGQGWSPAIVGEITKNLAIGKLGCDWWLSEADCRRHSQKALSRSERNYWISMRLLVQASLGRLPQ